MQILLLGSHSWQVTVRVLLLPVVQQVQQRLAACLPLLLPGGLLGGTHRAQANASLLRVAFLQPFVGVHGRSARCCTRIIIAGVAVRVVVVHVGGQQGGALGVGQCGVQAVDVVRPRCRPVTVTVPVPVTMTAFLLAPLQLKQ